jgi:hypothetical protein
MLDADFSTLHSRQWELTLRPCRTHLGATRLANSLDICFSDWVARLVLQGYGGTAGSWHVSTAEKPDIVGH